MAVNCNGTIEEYKKQVTCFDRKGKKVKKTIKAYRVRYRFERDGETHQTSKWGFTSLGEV